MKPTLLAIAVLFCSTQAAFAFQAGPPPGSEWKRDRSDRELIAEFAPKLALLDKNPGTQAVLKKLAPRLRTSSSFIEARLKDRMTRASRFISTQKPSPRSKPPTRLSRSTSTVSH